MPSITGWPLRFPPLSLFCLSNFFHYFLHGVPCISLLTPELSMGSFLWNKHPFARPAARCLPCRVPAAWCWWTRVGPKKIGRKKDFGNQVQCHFETGRRRGAGKRLVVIHVGMHLGLWTHQRRPFGEEEGKGFDWQRHGCWQALRWLETGEMRQDLPATATVFPQAWLRHMDQFDRCGAALLSV